MSDAGPSRPSRRRRRDSAFVDPPPHQPRDRNVVLALPREEHRTHFTKDERNRSEIRFRSHQPVLKYIPAIESRIKTLGLIHLVRLRDIYTGEKESTHFILDSGLLTALVEYWRPETNTFHLPFGEMTVGLQDVGCLWGLRTKGEVVSGWTDKDWSAEIRYLFDVEDITSYRRADRWSIPFKKLRAHFAVPPPVHDEAGLDRYAIAFALELLGCVMFPDHSGDSIPAFHLGLLMDDLVNPKLRNWGAAVLAYLYRGLNQACRSLKVSIGAPWLLLVMWSWTRLPPCRPLPYKEEDVFSDWGTPDLDTCAPYGRFDTKLN